MLCNRSEGRERISTPPGHVISKGSAPGARVVTCRGGGGGGGGNSLKHVCFENIFPGGLFQTPLFGTSFMQHVICAEILKGFALMKKSLFKKYFLLYNIPRA